MKVGMVALGVALAVLFIVGLSSGASPWLVWLDLVCAIASLLVAFVPDSQIGVLTASPYVISAGLIMLWIVGLATMATPWLAWWTFAFGVAYAVLGLSRLAAPEYPRRDVTHPRAI
jgi:hypothetical protein